MGQSIPLVCQDWANTKAAYRFFSNDRVSEADILAGHFQSTRDRAAATEDLVLVLHDTTEFSYQRERSEAIGITKSINSGRDKAGRLRSHTVCGILMHSSLAVTIEGIPLGLAAVKFWTRKKFKGTAAGERFLQPPLSHWSGSSEKLSYEHLLWRKPLWLIRPLQRVPAMRVLPTERCLKTRRFRTAL